MGGAGQAGLCGAAGFGAAGFGIAGFGAAGFGTAGSTAGASAAVLAFAAARADCVGRGASHLAAADAVGEEADAASTSASMAASCSYCRSCCLSRPRLRFRVLSLGPGHTFALALSPIPI